jgi:hypothetical protein
MYSSKAFILFTNVYLSFNTFVNMKQETDTYQDLLQNYDDFKCPLLKGRYLKEDDILQTFRTISHKFKIKNEGFSEEGRIISSFRLGHGENKILIWSQMHGNESTTTKSVLDLLNFLAKDSTFAHKILRTCKFVIVPVLNPDGAKAYTRVNANKVDLNRDASEQTQSESKVLQHIYKTFEPDVCFNMHDQRTIFSAGNHKQPSTVSFLSPSYNADRDINKTRLASMSLISAANRLLQHFIPGKVGRYDDSFNINCIGDYFQSKQTPTVLFEAGHYPEDYAREETRKYIFLALLYMIQETMSSSELNPPEDYFSIPENEKYYFDVILRDVKVNNQLKDVAIQYKEELKDDAINFIPIIEQVGDLKTYYGHREIDVLGVDLEFDEAFSFISGEILKPFKLNNIDIVV